MAAFESYDLINGLRVPPTVVTVDTEMTTTHSGTVIVNAGKFTLIGILRGTLSLRSSTLAHILGSQEGTVHIARGAHLTVSGTIQGTVAIDEGATLTIEPTGKLSGTLHNDGTMVLRGVFGGAQCGFGQVLIEGGYIKAPSSTKDGISFYQW